MDSLLLENHQVIGVHTAQGDFYSHHVILCAGHSASDTYAALLDQGVAIEQKDFAAGVRVEHPQALIDQSTYGRYAGQPQLGPASYQLTAKTKVNRGVYSFCMEKVIKAVVDPKLVDENTKYLINPSGSFVLGGSWGDSGTTGRKIVVDTYGGYAPIGGGCFSSKDPTKVDRSAAYYARYVCRNVVANGLAHKCQIELSYAIGEPKPTSVYVQSFGTSKYSDDELQEIVLKNFDFSVSNIIKELDLRKPIYKKTVNYGHFGKKDLPWEQFKKITL